MLDMLTRTTATALGLTMLAVAASLLAGCTMLSTDLQRAAPAAAPAPESQAPAADDNARPAGWTEATHSNDVDPNWYRESEQAIDRSRTESNEIAT